MQTSSTADRQRIAMGTPRILALPRVLLGLVYLAGYVLLDWVSFIEPFAPFGITPWNPPTGLSFVLILLSGRRLIPLLFIAPLLADLIVRHLALPWTLELATAILIGGSYTLVLMFLMTPRIRFDPALSSLRDLVLLLLAASVGAAFAAAGFVGMTVSAGVLPAADFAAAALRYWIGDVIGISVITPFSLIMLTRTHSLSLSIETLLQFAAILAALALVFEQSARQQFEFSYILFLPIVWIAVRTGLHGVCIGILVTQLSLIGGLQLLPKETLDVTAFQGLMIVLAMTGLVAGALVTERQRTEIQLRLHQNSLAQLARLGSMGEFAAVLAHEINQPLMAAGSYTRLVRDTLRTGTKDIAAVAEQAQKAVAQVERAAEVVRRLRALVRLDRSGQAPYDIAIIIQAVIELCKPDLDRGHIAAHQIIPYPSPLAMVDKLQIEQVLLNLIRNSIEAIIGAGYLKGEIFIEVSRGSGGFIEICVRDTGPGFSKEISLDSPLPFLSTKVEGLGIGLSLSRSIVEAHGGRLRLDNQGGAAVYITVPEVGRMSHE